MTTRRKIGIAVGVVVVAVTVAVLLWASGKPQIEAKFLRYTASNWIVIVVTNLSRTAVQCVASPPYSPSLSDFPTAYDRILEPSESWEFPLGLQAGTTNGAITLRYGPKPGRLYRAIEPITRRFGFEPESDKIQLDLPPPPKTPLP